MSSQRDLYVKKQQTTNNNSNNNKRRTSWKEQTKNIWDLHQKQYYFLRNIDNPLTTLHYTLHTMESMDLANQAIVLWTYQVHSHDLAWLVVNVQLDWHPACEWEERKDQKKTTTKKQQKNESRVLRNQEKIKEKKKRRSNCIIHNTKIHKHKKTQRTPNKTSAIAFPACCPPKKFMTMEVMFSCVDHGIKIAPGTLATTIVFWLTAYWT